jgi:predicted chitinase
MSNSKIQIITIDLCEETSTDITVSNAIDKITFQVLMQENFGGAVYCLKCLKEMDKSESSVPEETEILFASSMSRELDISSHRNKILQVHFFNQEKLLCERCIKIEALPLKIDSIRFTDPEFKNKNKIAGKAGVPIGFEVGFNRKKLNEKVNLQYAFFAKFDGKTRYEEVPSNRNIFEISEQQKKFTIKMQERFSGAQIACSFFLKNPVIPKDSDEMTVRYIDILSEEGALLKEVYWSTEETISYGKLSSKRTKIAKNEDAFLHIHSRGMYGKKVTIGLYEEDHTGIGGAKSLCLTTDTAIIKDNVACVCFSMSDVYSKLGYKRSFEGGDLELCAKVEAENIQAKTSEILKLNYKQTAKKPAKSSVEGTMKFVIKDLDGNDEKQEKKKKCPNCDKDITLDEMKQMFPDVSDDTLNKVASSYNKYMKHLNMNTCWVKAHFFAQAAIETGYKLDVKTGEGMDYSEQGLYNTFPSRFFKGKKEDRKWKSEYDNKAKYHHTDGRVFIDEARSKKAGELRGIADKQERMKAIANFIYAGINGNGDEKSGDGWRFRGSGLVQLTGRSNFEKVHEKIQELWDKSILTDSGADEVRTNLELAILTSMGYFVFSEVHNIANQTDTDKKILAVCKKIGNDHFGKNGESTNHVPKMEFYKGKSSVAFKVKECLWEKEPVPEEQTIRIEVERLMHNSTRTIGNLKVDKGKISGFSLERDGIPEEKERKRDSKKRISAGTYEFIINTTGEDKKKYHKTLRLLKVPGRTGILFHGGNKFEYSEGCILGNRNKPIKDTDNSYADSCAFVLEIVKYVKEREKEIKEKYNLEKVEKKFIITQENEINS